VDLRDEEVIHCLNSEPSAAGQLAPDKGSGNPHMNPDEKPLSESETWKSHKSHGTAKPKKRE
jgi:hypothetical protein